MEDLSTSSSLYDELPYHPLHFRLLRAVYDESGDSPGIGDHDSDEYSRVPLKDEECCEFELEVFIHEEAPSYVALSYTWGNPFPASHELASGIDWIQETQTVIINGRSVAIRQNLADALRELSKSSLMVDWFWVDAICINQDDDVEKNRQVSKMREIYTSADAVDVWLGRADSLTEDAWSLDSECLSQLWERLQHDRDMADLHCFLDPREPGTVEMFREIAPEAQWFTAWAKIHHRTWFTRLWVLQECALNFSNVLFYCGHRSYNLLRHMWVFECASSLLRSEYPSSNPGARDELNVYPALQPFFYIPPKDDGQWLHTTTSYRFIKQISAFTDGGPSTATLLKMLLFETRLLNTANPRDKLFAILGLHQHLQELMGTPQVIVFGVDYRDTAAHTFRSFTEHVLRNCASLSIFSFWADMTINTVDNVPTWVPDYSRKDSFETGVNGERSTVFTQHWDMSLNAANVDTRKPGDLLRTFGPKSLTLLGSFLDSIVDVEKLDSKSGPPRLETEGEDEWATIYKILAFSLHLPAIYVNGQERIEAVWRTLLWDYWSTGDMSPTASETARHFQNYILGALCLSVGHAFANASYSNCTWDGLQDRRSEVRELADAHVRVMSLCHALIPAAPSRSPDATGEYAPSTPLTHPITAGYNAWVSQLVGRFRERLASDGNVAATDFFSTCMARALAEFKPFRRHARYFNRTLFRTEKTGYIGLGPMSARPGDEVWLLENGRAAYVLRPVDKVAEDYRWEAGGRKLPEPAKLYRLVGECYVHGIMRGELWGPRLRRGPCAGRDSGDEEAPSSNGFCTDPMCQVHSILGGKIFATGENPPLFEEVTII